MNDLLVTGLKGAENCLSECLDCLQLPGVAGSAPRAGTAPAGAEPCLSCSGDQRQELGWV